MLKEFQHCDLTFLSNCKYTSLDIDTGYIFAASDHSVCVFSSESGEVIIINFYHKNTYLNKFHNFIENIVLILF